MAPAPPYVDPCNGHFTHPQARGQCPIEIVSENRKVTSGKRSATVPTSVPTGLQDTITASDLAFLNITDHTTDVGFDFGGASVEDLYHGAQSGIIPPGDAMAEMGRRIPTSDEAAQRTLVATISAIENLVKVGYITKAPMQSKGNLLRLWACVTKRTKKLTGPLLVVEGTTQYI